MSGQVIGLIAGLAAVPAMLFLVFYFAFGRRAVLASVVTASLGTAGGAFLASAGSAMATSVNQNDALLQGAAIGFGGSAIVALAVRLLLNFCTFSPPQIRADTSRAFHDQPPVTGDEIVKSMVTSTSAISILEGIGLEICRFAD